MVTIFFVGMRYLDPPEEYGIAVNFGTSDVGMGDIQPNAPLKPASEEIIEEQEEIIETVSAASSEAISEEVATQDAEEAIVIKKASDKKKVDDLAEKKRLEDTRIAKEKQDAIAKKQAEEAEKRKKLDAMIGGINNANGTANGGEGNDNSPGDKGQLNGDPYAPSYFGNDGKGNVGVGYGLNGRGKPTSTTYTQECNEYGLVVVRIEVDRQGNVIKAALDLKYTQNDAPCLVEPAKKIALTFKWPSDNKAPIRQIGYISINFKNVN